MAAGERLGGLAPATRAAAQALANAFDVVVIETVGVGQSETDVAEAADTVAVIVQPGGGDALQFLKAGIMEVPDVLVVTKADLGAPARRAEEDLRAALGTLGAAAPGRSSVSSLRPTAGIDALADALQAHRDGLDLAATRTRVAPPRRARRLRARARRARPARARRPPRRAALARAAGAGARRARAPARARAAASARSRRGDAVARLVAWRDAAMRVPRVERDGAWSVLACRRPSSIDLGPDTGPITIGRRCVVAVELACERTPRSGVCSTWAKQECTGLRHTPPQAVSGTRPDSAI